MSKTLLDQQLKYLFIQPGLLVQETKRHAIGSLLHPTEHGWFPRVAGHYHDRPAGCHDHILIFCTAGKGYCGLYHGDKGEKTTLHIGPQMCLILPAGTPHCYGADEDDPWSIHWVHFSGTHSAWWTSSPGFCFEVGFERIAKLRDLFEDMNFILARGSHVDNMILASAVLGHILALICHPMYMPARRQDPDTHRLEAVIRFMQDNIRKHVTLEQLASIANYSPTQFIKVFRQHTGFPPKEYWQRLRIRAACTLLDEGNLPIKEIATDVGFSDQLYFSRVFSSVMGESPSTYRERPKG